MRYVIIYLLNIADWALTVYWTGLHGIQAEINPIMRFALSCPGAFAVVKLLLFPLLLLWMRHKRHDDSALIALGMFLAVTWLNICTIFG